MKLTEHDIRRHAPEYGETNKQVPCEKCVESEESHRNDTMDYDTLFSAYELRSEQNTSALPATTKMAPFSPSVLVMFLLMLFVGGMGACGIICASLSLMTPVEGLLLVSFMFLLLYAFTEGVRRSFGTVRQKRTMHYIGQAFLILAIAVFTFLEQEAQVFRLGRNASQDYSSVLTGNTQSTRPASPLLGDSLPHVL